MNPSGASDLSGLYSGSSMLGTFVPGDRIETQETPFSALTPGDVLLFSKEGKRIVHRIVGGSAERGWITRGDHNITDDPWLVTAADSPRLVTTRIDPGGKSFPVLNGGAGLSHHRRLQKKRRLECFLSRLIPRWCRNAPLRFLLPRRSLSLVRFGEVSALYRGELLIATRKAGAPWQFRRRWMRLFFLPPDESADIP